MLSGEVLTGTTRRVRRSSFPRGAQERTRAYLGSAEVWLVFGASLLLNLVMVYTVVFRFNLFVTDAMSRTIHAWQVFLSATPKLTAIGFIWAPLPTLLQLPLALIPPLRVDGISGNALTAIMGALTVVTLNQIFKACGVGRFYRYAMLALYSLNPMILFYASNGMSEMTFIFFTMLSIHALLRWQRSGHFIYLGLLGGTVALACLARYDTVVHAALLVGVIWLLSAQMGQPIAAKSQAMVIFYAMPVAFAVGLWVMFNWIFMGDPLHFVRGEYSNAAQISYQLVMLPRIAALTHNPVAIVLFIAEQVALLFPAFLVTVTILTIDFLATRNRLAISLAALALSFPIFQAMNMFGGQSAAFARYFILAVPYGFVLAGFTMGRIPPRRAAQRHALSLALLLLLTASSVATGYSMYNTKEWGQWNDAFIEAMLTQRPATTWAEEREIARYLLANVEGRDVLVDDFQGYRVVFFSGKPALFVANADNDFAATLADPVGKVKYILAPPLTLEGVLNQVNKKYPSLYEHGAEWATLEKEWPELGWRLYRVAESGIGS